jgi:hypothetical protein
MVRDVEVEGIKIPISVDELDGVNIISVDGVEWVKTENKVHAAVLFNMIADHLTEYMQYKKK